MTIDEYIAKAEEDAKMAEFDSEWGIGNYFIDRTEALEYAKECRQLAEWLKELKRLRTEHEARANKESARYVFDELLNCSLFRGVYDARNGKEDFMYGVCTVMENIAYMISEEAHDKFDTEFMANMSKSMEVNADDSN